MHPTRNVPKHLIQTIGAVCKLEDGSTQLFCKSIKVEKGTIVQSKVVGIKLCTVLIASCLKDIKTKWLRSLY